MKKFILLIFAIIIIFYLPIIINSELFLSRGNDLQEFFWPLFYYVRKQIISTHTIPLWNTMFLSGTPLLPDPQSPIFYIPNVIFLIFPINTAFIISAILHTFWGAFWIFLIANKLLKFSTKTSFLASSMYIFLIRNAGYIEAGHFGLIIATSWIPVVMYSSLRLTSKLNFNYSILLAVSLSAIFLTHTTTFIYVVVTLIVAIAFIIIFDGDKTDKRSSIFKLITKNILNLNSIKLGFYFLASAIILFGLIAIVLLPQLEWIPTTTRSLLGKTKEVYPIWLGFDEIIKSIWFPWLGGISYIQNIETEKWLFLGIIPSMLAIYGLLKINLRIKITFAMIVIVVGLLTLNNLSPFYEILLNQKWYLFGRVSTRAWYVVSISIVLLASYGLEVLTLRKKKFFTNMIVLATILELMVINVIHISKPIINDRELAPEGVYEYLSNDDDIFRVFCTNRCLSQQKVAIYGLETIEGYSTLHQLNYYKHSWQLTGAYWDYYSLTLPPIGTYKYGKLNPDFEALGEYNVKYIISPYEIDNTSLNMAQYITGYYIYINNHFLPRAYYLNASGNKEKLSINLYTSNDFIVETGSVYPKSVFISNIYNNGWKSTDGSGLNLKINEAPISIQTIDLKKDTESIKIYYFPKSFRLGMMITFITFALLFGRFALKFNKVNPK